MYLFILTVSIFAIWQLKKLHISAWKNLYDCAVVVSNDSDLSEALRIIKTELNKSVGIFIPWRAFPSKDLLKYADFIKHIRRNLLENSQLPNPIPNTNIFKPIAW